jgi:uncharacterized protein YuzE
MYFEDMYHEKSCKTTKANQGLVIDYGESGNPIGIEITAPLRAA